MTNGTKPDYTGITQALTEKNYVQKGTIALWEQATSNNKHPCFKGTVTIGDQRYAVSIWERIEATTQ